MDVITLGQGEPDFETSLAACEAGICRNPRRADEKQHAGREQAAAPASQRDFSRGHGLDSSIDQTTVFCGAKQAVFDANFASLDAGSMAIQRPTQ
ncbi:hypothetical protein [Bradyrhizobium shewense]|uniref:hypothetical protein n=1 Tax=Bradyrhizobium shewense TaxID=1761772 RepID=UPI00101AE82C|nr:hypothetical protein [Bradyrhizobium shewense]